MSGISDLPKLSEAFLAHVSGRTVEKNEWMPCPRCGESHVKPPAGGVIGGVSGCAGIGCWIPIVLLGTVLFAVVWLPLGIGFLILGLLAIPLIPLLGVGIGLMYKCDACDFSWTFPEIEKYQAENRDGEP